MLNTPNAILCSNIMFKYMYMNILILILILNKNYKKKKKIGKILNLNNIF